MSSLERSAALSAVIEMGTVWAFSAILRAETITVSRPLPESALWAMAEDASARTNKPDNNSVIFCMARPELFLCAQRFMGDAAKKKVRQDSNRSAWDFFPI